MRRGTKRRQPCYQFASSLTLLKSSSKFQVSCRSRFTSRFPPSFPPFCNYRDHFPSLPVGVILAYGVAITGVEALGSLRASRESLLGLSNNQSDCQPTRPGARSAGEWIVAISWLLYSGLTASCKTLFCVGVWDWICKNCTYSYTFWRVHI